MNLPVSDRSTWPPHLPPGPPGSSAPGPGPAELGSSANICYKTSGAWPTRTGSLQLHQSQEASELYQAGSKHEREVRPHLNTPHFTFTSLCLYLTLPYLTLSLPHFTFTSPHLGQKESNYLHFQPARQPRPSNWSIPSVMVFKNLQTKININLDFMSWTCNIISPSHTAKRWEGYFLKCSQKSEQNTQHLTIF